MSTIRELFSKTRLNKTDAKVLMAHVCYQLLKWPKSALISHDTDLLPQNVIELWNELESKRINGEPIAYLIGHREFHEINLQVGPGVLIPRPETELLVEIGLEEIKRCAALNLSKISLLDLGTGSGAIALAIAKAAQSMSELQLEIIAIDQSLEALSIAKKNCTQLGLNSIVSFYQSDWYKNLPVGKFQIILSTPPYIPKGDPHLIEGDLRFEPASALTDDNDGLDAYRTIVGQASEFLQPTGLLAVEHGYNQKADVQALFLKNNFKSIQTIKDLAGLDRVTLGRIG